MSRTDGILIAILGILTLASTCQQDANQPPTVPGVSGPGFGRPGEDLTFTSMSEDPEAQEIAYKFAWGDTSPIEWSPFYASGQPVLRTHAYDDTGVYYVKARHAGILVYLKKLGDWIEEGEAVARIINPLPESDDQKVVEVQSRTAGLLFSRNMERFARPGKIIAKIAGSRPLSESEGDLLTL